MTDPVTDPVTDFRTDPMNRPVDHDAARAAPRPRRPRGLRLAAALACVALQSLSASARAHEFWVEPVTPPPAVGDNLEANLHTGQYLKADPSSWDPDRFVRLELVDAEGAREIDGERTQLPAVRVPVRVPGLQILAGESRPQSVRYPSFEKFEAFTRFEGAPEIAAGHLEAGLPTQNIVELYTRYPKALVRVGEAAPSQGDAAIDRAIGLGLELVALDDPFAPAMDPAVTDPEAGDGGADEALRYELLLDGEPLPDVQVALFHREAGISAEPVDPDASVVPAGVTRVLERTDADGRVDFARPGAGTSLVSAVLIRRPTPRAMLESGAMWESLWASSTFVLD